MRVLVGLAVLLLSTNAAVGQFVPGMNQPNSLPVEKGASFRVDERATPSHQLSLEPHSQLREAADWYTGPSPIDVPGVPYLGFLGGGMGPDYHHASTALEGSLRGMADVIDARGRYSLLNAEARIRNQYAYRLSLDNKLRYTAIYWARREIRDIARANERARRRGSSKAVSRPVLQDLPLINLHAQSHQDPIQVVRRAN